MLKNYIKIAWRSIGHNKFSSLINIGGLAVGMGVAILIGLWIWDSLCFNKYFDNYDRIVQVMQHQTINGNVITQRSMPIPLGYKLGKDYKDDFKQVVLSTGTDDHLITWGDKKLTTVGSYMQSGAPDLFSLKMLYGNRAALKDPSSIILSSSLAKALFGNADPMNKAIKIDARWNVKVAGVFDDLPKSTTINQITFIAPWDLYVNTEPWVKRNETRWGNNSWNIYAQLNPNADMERVSARIKNLELEGLAAQGDKVGVAFKASVFLFPMSKWHLYGAFKNGINTGGRIQFVWMFGIIGVFVLLLACINFMNLSTARSEKRAREVGIRKTMGSLRSQLIAQFFGESIMVTLLSLVLALILVQFNLGWFNQVANKNMSVLWFSPVFWLICIGFSLFTGVIAGSYPAFYLSSFQPVKVLKGTFKAGKFAVLPRKVLVVLQFTVSIALIIGTIVVFRQVQFTKNRPVGYNRDGLIQVKLKTETVHKHFAAIRADLMASDAIVDMAESGSPLTAVWSNSSGLEWRGKDPNLQDDFGIVRVSPEFGNTTGWKVINGRDFSKTMLTDSSAVVLNQAAVKFMGLKQPIGELIKFGDNYKVIGVVNDMVMSSPYEPVKPTIFMMATDAEEMATIRINPKINMGDALKKIEAVFRQYDPETPFDYDFTDREYAKKFDDEVRVGSLAAFFTTLAIFISCLGLFGMASFMAEQRTKEIGVRKVLGASVFNLWRMLTKDFVLLVFISILIAAPATYWFMHNWLQNYQYRVTISWWIFAITALGTISITLLTVSYQSIKAALANPVKSLRSE